MKKNLLNAVLLSCLGLGILGMSCGLFESENIIYGEYEIVKVHGSPLSVWVGLHSATDPPGFDYPEIIELENIETSFAGRVKMHHLGWFDINETDTREFGFSITIDENEVLLGPVSGIYFLPDLLKEDRITGEFYYSGRTIDSAALSFEAKR